MKLGLGLGVCHPRGATAAAWTPVSLSGLVATVLPALSRSQGKLWQDASKTIAATADGDPVRVAVCPYTAVEFTAPSDAARPLLYDEGGDSWSLSFDGADDYLSAGDLSAGFSTSGTVVLGQRTASGASPPLQTSSNGQWRSFAAIAFMGVLLANRVTPGVDNFPPAGSWGDVTTRSGGSGWETQLDGSAVATAAADFSGGNRWWIGACSDAGGATPGRYWAGRVSGLIASAGYLTGTDLSNSQTYVRALRA